MIQDALRRLRLDRRLARRKGWVPAEELAKALADLPDVSDKIDRTPPQEDVSEPESEATQS